MKSSQGEDGRLLPAVRLLPLGDAAWTVEFGRDIDPVAHARVICLADQVRPLLATAGVFRLGVCAGPGRGFRCVRLVAGCGRAAAHRRLPGHMPLPDLAQTEAPAWLAAGDTARWTAVDRVERDRLAF